MQIEDVMALDPPALVKLPSFHSANRIEVQIKEASERAASQRDAAEEEEKMLIDTCNELGKPKTVEDEYKPEFDFCGKKKKCGHSCLGVKDERKCLPCLNEVCAKKAGLYDDMREDELC